MQANKSNKNAAEEQTIESLEVDMGDLDMKCKPLSAFQLRSIQLHSKTNKQKGSQKRLQAKTTKGVESADSETPPSNIKKKKAKTSFDHFIDQELKALVGEEFHSQEMVKHVGAGLRERWKSMSVEETMLYEEVINEEDEKEAQHLRERLNMTPSFEAILKQFLQPMDPNNKTGTTKAQAKPKGGGQ